MTNEAVSKRLQNLSECAAALIQGGGASSIDDSAHAASSSPQGRQQPGSKRGSQAPAAANKRQRVEGAPQSLTLASAAPSFVFSRRSRVQEAAGDSDDDDEEVAGLGDTMTSVDKLTLAPTMFSLLRWRRDVDDTSKIARGIGDQPGFNVLLEAKPSGAVPTLAKLASAIPKAAEGDKIMWESDALLAALRLPRTMNVSGRLSVSAGAKFLKDLRRSKSRSMALFLCRAPSSLSVLRGVEKYDVDRVGAALRVDPQTVMKGVTEADGVLATKNAAAFMDMGTELVTAKRVAVVELSKAVVVYLIPPLSGFLNAMQSHSFDTRHAVTTLVELGASTKYMTAIVVFRPEALDTIETLPLDDEAESIPEPWEADEGQQGSATPSGSSGKSEEDLFQLSDSESDAEASKSPGIRRSGYTVEDLEEVGIQPATTGGETPPGEPNFFNDIVRFVQKERRRRKRTLASAKGKSEGKASQKFPAEAPPAAPPAPPASSIAPSAPPPYASVPSSTASTAPLATQPPPTSPPKRPSAISSLLQRVAARAKLPGSQPSAAPPPRSASVPSSAPMPPGVIPAHHPPMALCQVEECLLLRPWQQGQTRV